MIIKIAVIIELLVLIAMMIMGTRFYSHMLQLSSYQFQGYFRFLRTSNIKKNLIHLLMGVVLLVLMLTTDYKYVVIASIVFGIICLIMYRPQKAKKKFAVTKRVERLFVTDGIIFAIIVGIIAANQFSESHLLVANILSVVFFTLFPLITALANLINKPVEKQVNQYYINDAKRILREHPNLRIIGVTGSYGKTSVKYYLNTLLSEGFRVLITPESFNTPMGVVRIIRGDLKNTHEIFVCEMGARHVGDIKEICDIVHPDDGIVTSIGPQHLETFHNQQNIINTKYELLDAVEEKKTSDDAAGKHLKWVNFDNDFIHDNMKYSDAITYGTREGAAYRATDVSVSRAGTSFTVTTPSGESEEFTTKLIGPHNVQNVVGAIAVANSLGIPMNKLKMAVRRLQPVSHRLELIQRGSVTILDDAYNSNPAGAKTAIDTLALFTDSVKVLVTPGMVELGEKENELNMEFGRQAAKVCDYIILVGEKQTEYIKKGALEEGFSEQKLFVKNTLNEATALMYELDAGKEKVILLENDLPDNYTK
ncbi:MAG: UDP-N-acetylmuramoyl-tripeptide--D-alanyl-D-alanine ligase [Butyrivibrio sp.]|nr:UDP-N-acetylmuramoyl-tripeptide--D-alanyl-D-alanine ligase [Butyrivibrio sp.]